ncbi:Holliday junction resolvase [Marinitoga sp. 1135]|uniref:Crossover junction endodeoxyribonuclease RuvC n=1 Tax=Marinitoga piezophila (strain DSM 14283 / JCM 11233 / KA3) TaxID=443254 RepID=H2J3R3_MARPK|nr:MULTISPECIES: crossover junction endodeoxyribonuclease RuvC [Marinitoga]AEX85805.1 crossover junction endodeoxyribonuclease RuvC [Marinitoga piezophila KA3]APT76246.1 Holliday junction resolvase [Marinitoga sp. 1137]NUU96005.1 Holliday junction resolvase [Marinitoga sp. 1135]NUU97917.1 Holliday junction resolvase [Marinitoga sp. 1138]
MRILGIDPGYGRIGFGVIDKIGNTFKLIDFGVIETDKNADLNKRLLEIYEKMNELINKYNPDEAAVESLFFFKNVKTAIQVGEARGVILLTLQQAGLVIAEYTPYQVKQAITGYGRAEKGQIQRMLKTIFNLKKTPTPDDAADAIAIAFCHGNYRRF